MQARSFLCKLIEAKVKARYVTICSILLQHYKVIYQYVVTIIINLITQGEKCKQCDAVTHTYCLKTYTMGQSNLECPNCVHSLSGLGHLGNLYIFILD